MSASAKSPWETMSPLERLAFIEKLSGKPASADMREAAEEMELLKKRQQNIAEVEN